MWTKILSVICPPFAAAWNTIKLIGPMFQVLLIIALVVFGGVQTIRIDGLTIRPHIGPFHVTLISIQGLKKSNLICKSDTKVLKADLKNQAVAGKVERQNQAVVLKQAQVTSRNDAEDTNDRDIKNQAVVAAAEADYVRTHSVSDGMRNDTSQGDGLHSGKTPVSGSDRPSGGSDQTDLGAGMVTISVDDLSHYVDNTKDLVELRAFLAKLIADGIAISWDTAQVDKIPSVAPPQEIDPITTPLTK